MFVTFGILTNNKTQQVVDIIQSIENMDIPLDSYEIIVVGNVDLHEDFYQNFKIIHDKTVESKNWITKKKNLVVQHSSGSDDSLVIIGKDYIKYDKNWFKGLLEFHKINDFDIFMNQIHNENGKRYLDWIWNHPILGNGRNIDYRIKGHPGMFAPGCITFAKKKVFKKYPFAERLVGLGKESDIVWSKRAFSEFSYTFNIHSKCIAFGKGSNRFPKFRRKCVCDYCTSYKFN